MKKHNLSDLIRDEASQEVKSQNTTTKTIDQTTEIDKMSSTSRSRMTKAQLDELVTQLTTALEKSKNQVETLQTQVNSLENDLKQNTELVDSLQTKLNETAQDESELAEQKKLIEKLYSQLQQKEDLVIELEEKNQVIESLKTELEQAKVSTTSLKKPSQSSEIVAKKEIQKESALTRQARELEAFTAPPAAKKQKELTDEDIGWFD
ncbi:MAG: hypothetical protein AAGF26_17800 [Cyanobacteria bacterium P01_G01_bin.49]